MNVNAHHQNIIGRERQERCSRVGRPMARRNVKLSVALGQEAPADSSFSLSESGTFVMYHS